MLVDKMSDGCALKISITETSRADLNLECNDYAAISDLLEDLGFKILYDPC